MDSIWQFLGVKGVSTQHHSVNSHQTVCPDTKVTVLASVQAPGFPSHSRTRELGVFIQVPQVQARGFDIAVALSLGDKEKS